MFGRLTYRKSKFRYYVRAVCKTLLTPRGFCRARLRSKLAKVARYDREYIRRRVNHCNGLTQPQTLSDRALAIGAVDRLARPRVYSFDSQEYLRHFDASLRLRYVWGDVTHVPDEPAFVKSRPIGGDNANAVLLKLDKVRHFNFIRDERPFAGKKNQLIGRGAITQPHRIRFYERYFDHPLCDLGQTNDAPNPQWKKDKLTIGEHLAYKFILALEGNDVATNLKWIMSSNSLAVMPTPRFETWFMESTLIADHHYVHIADDYANLEEKLAYYIANPDAALRIVENANAYARQFQDAEREALISLLVIEKYFYRTAQRQPIDPSLYDEA